MHDDRWVNRLVVRKGLFGQIEQVAGHSIVERQLFDMPACYNALQDTEFLLVRTMEHSPFALHGKHWAQAYIYKLLELTASKGLGLCY